MTEPQPDSRSAADRARAAAQAWRRRPATGAARGRTARLIDRFLIVVAALEAENAALRQRSSWGVLCPDCDHGVRGGTPCETCAGRGTVHVVLADPATRAIGTSDHRT